MTPKELPGLPIRDVTLGPQVTAQATDTLRVSMGPSRREILQ